VLVGESNSQRTSRGPSKPSDENAFGASDVAEPIHVLVLDHFVDELRLH
jgi:hypothetical protein